MKKMNTAYKNIQAKLTKGLLDLIILQLLETHPMHGYELISTIRKSYGVTFGASTIYPLLGNMEKKRFIKCEWNMNGERPRKVYGLTTDGKSMLDYTAGSLKTICRTMGTGGNQVREDHLQFNIAQPSKNNDHFVY